MHDAYIVKLQGILGYFPPSSMHEHFLAEDPPPLVNKSTETLKTLPSHYTSYVHGNKHRGVINC